MQLCQNRDGKVVSVKFVAMYAKQLLARKSNFDT